MVDGTLTLRSDDSRLVAVYESGFSIDLERSSANPAIYVSGNVPSPDAASDTPSELGFPKQSRDGFDELALGFHIDVDENDQLSGEITLLGYTHVPCPDGPADSVCPSIPTTLERGTLR